MKIGGAEEIRTPDL